MNTPRSPLAKLAGHSRHSLVIGFAIALACAVPVFAANSFNDANNGDVAATTVVVNAPSGLSTGDVMIASVLFRGPSTTTVTSPGWTQIAARTNTQGSTDTTLVSFWNEADGTEAAQPNFTFTLSVGARAFGGIARYDDVIVTSGTPVAAQVTNPISDDNGQATTATASSVTTTAPGQYVTAVFGEGDGDSISTPSGMSPLYNNGRTTGTEGRLAAFDVSQAQGASGDKVATLGGNQPSVTHTIALKTEPTKLGFSTSPHTGVVDACLGPITVQTQNTAGGATNPLSDKLVDVSTDGIDTGSFFANAACDNALDDPAERTIGTGATGFSFYYKPTDRGDGSHEITATTTGLTQNSAAQTQTVKLAQTIDWPNVLPTSEEYGDSFGVGTATAEETATGNPSGLPVTITPSGGCSLAGSNATMTSGTTDCTLTASQPGDSTYAAAPNIVRQVDANLRPITVTADSGQSKVYSDDSSTDPTSFTHQITSGSLVGTDSLSGALTRDAGETVAGSPYAITQGTLSAGSNYNLTFVGADFNITKKQLLVNANTAQKTYGGTEPSLTAALVGFISGENKNNASGYTGSESCSRTSGETVAGSPYTITCTPGTLAADNYSFATGSTAGFTINPAELNVNADPASKTYGDTDPAFTATLAGFVNSEDASSAAVTGSANCTRAGVGTDEDANTYTGAISCVPDTLAAPNYTFTAGAPADFTIDPRTAHVTSTIADKVYDQTTAAQILTSVLTNRAPGETSSEVDFTGGTFSAAFDTASAGTNKPVDVSSSPPPTLTGTEAANYTLVVDDATADITPKSVDGSFTAANKVYDGGAAATVTSRSIDAADVISPDVVTLTGGAANFANRNVGDNKTVTLTGASLGGADGANYQVGTIATDTANITKRNVTGSFTVADKNYDGTTAATITSRSVNGEVAGDLVALVLGTATFSDPTPGADKTVTGSGFALGGPHAGNYNLTGVGTTTATISRQPAGNTPPPPDVEEAAEQALGGPVKDLGLDLGGLGFAFAPENQTNTLKVGKRALKLFAIGGCDTPCTVKAAKTLVPIGSSGGASAAADIRRIKLKAQNFSLAAGEFGVVKLNKLSRKQRKAIRKAQKTKLIVKVTLTAGAQQVTAKKKYRLKLAK